MSLLKEHCVLVEGGLAGSEVHVGRPPTRPPLRGVYPLRRVVLVWPVLAPLAIMGGLRADAGNPDRAGIPVVFQDGVARALIRSHDEYLVVIDPAQRGTAASAIRAVADDRADPRYALPSDVITVRVRAGVADGESALRRAGGVRVVRPGYRLSSDVPPFFETGEIVIAFKPGVSAAQRGRIAADLGLGASRRIAGLPDTYAYRVVPEGRDTIVIAAAAHAHVDVRYSHPDFFAPKDSLDIDDPFFPEQWHLLNMGQGGGEALADINVLPAWEITLGAGSTIAVLDNGHEIEHPDLVAALVGSYDYAEGDSDPAGGAHGTSVSGLAVARANTIGVRGVAPQSGWVAMRYGSDVGVAESFALADTYGAVVHSNSWKYSDASYLPTVVRDAVVNAVTNARGGQGIAVVFAAANDFAPLSTKSALAAMPETIAVGASTNFDHKADYSNFGAELDLLAPSSGGTLNVTTTFPGSAYTSAFGGTSASTPQVAGAVALVLSVNPDLSAAQVRRILQHTAQPIDSVVSPATPVTAHSNWGGYGRLDVYAALQAAQWSLANGSATWPAPVTQLTAADGPASITLSWVPPGEDFAAALVVASRHLITWTPSDGAAYSVGQVVEPGVTIRHDGASSTFTHVCGPGPHYYAVFAHNAVQRYSWGVATVGVAGGAVVLSEGFEAGAGGWTHEGLQDSWTLGTPSYFAGPMAAAVGNGVYGTNLLGDYANASTPAVTQIATLRSPLLDLTGGNFACATFLDWLGVEGGTYDYVRLDVISATGAPLATLIDQYQDNHNAWQRHGMDLSAWAGSSVRLEFSLWANDVHTGPGWYIDDFRLVVGNVPQVSGDADVDGDVDLADYAQWHACQTAPGAAAPAACANFDIDSDADVDLGDLAVFQAAFTGAF